MIKRLSLFALLICVCSIHAFADKQVRVKLNDVGHNRHVINEANYKIAVELKDIDQDGGTATIGFSITNLSDSRVIMIYDKPYTEKEIKKTPPKTKYSNSWPAIDKKGKRVIKFSESLNETIHIDPSGEAVITESGCNDGDSIKLIIPIYQAESPNYKLIPWIKRKLKLVRMDLIEINVGADIQPGALYTSIKDRYDILKKDLDSAIFCTNELHAPSLDEQKEFYKNRIDSIVTDIDNIVNTYGWYSTDNNRRYIMYANLRDALLSFDLNAKEGDCGFHKKASVSHKCRFCRLSLQQIYHKLDDIYQMLYNGKIVKDDQVKNDVYWLHRCAKQRRDWSGSEYKSNISRLNSAIKEF